MTTVDARPQGAATPRVEPGERRWIGKSIKRVEDPRLLRGKGRYIDDIKLPKMAHAAILRSPTPTPGSSASTRPRPSRCRASSGS
jgi:hypothetical protein